MRYAVLADAYERLEATTKRLEMTDLLVGLFREVPRDEIDRVVYLTQGRVFPDYAGIELGLAEKLAIKIVPRAMQAGEDAVKRERKGSSDLDDATQDRLQNRIQVSLMSDPLTVDVVHQNPRELATAPGSEAPRRGGRRNSEEDASRRSGVGRTPRRGQSEGRRDELSRPQ